MSFTIEALLGIQPKVEDEQLPIRIPRSCSEDEESNEEDIELEGESCCELVYYLRSNRHLIEVIRSSWELFTIITTSMQLYETLWYLLCSKQ